MLTRIQYVEICSSCENRKFDPQKGVVCSLTSAIADFENECPSYVLDEKTIVHHRVEMSPDEPEFAEIKNKAEKDILFGALWCFGGIFATVADFGYIFWGAIVFGGIQLVQGLIALPANKNNEE